VTLALLALLVGLQAPHELTAHPAPAAQGDVVLVETGAAPLSASLDGAVPFFRDGDRWVALVGIDAEARPGRRDLRVRWEDGEATLRFDVRAKAFPTERLRVEPRYVEPPPEVAARIAAEKARLDRLWERRSPERRWQGGFRRPVSAEPSSAFGLQRVFNGQRRSPHNGVDFPVGAGIPVAAANAGEVAVAEDLYFTGNTVIVDHGLGLYTTYAHLSEIEVRVGQPIAAGAIVGRVGATGRATGPHLHWGARLLAARVDPMQLLRLNTKEDGDGAGGR